VGRAPHDPQRLGREEPAQGADARLEEAVELEADRSAFFDLDAQPLGVAGQEVRDHLVQLGQCLTTATEPESS